MQVASEPPQSGRSRRLEALLIAEIQRHGPMPFARFMERALYDPDGGYYSAAPLPWGPQGDYITAPQVHPALGHSIARLAVELDESLGSPARFSLVEHGSGNGALAAAVLGALQALAPGLWERLAMVSVEAGPRAREAQTALPVPPGGLDVVSPADYLPADRQGLVFANELLDAFPVHRVRCQDGRIRQSHVVVDDGFLRERFLVPRQDAKAIAGYLVDNEIELSEGQVGELCLGVRPWLAKAVDGLTGGVLLVDYGHPTAALFGASRRRGTLVAQRRFQLFDDVLTHPGDRDLTAHVDLGNLQRAAAGLGLEWAGTCSLRVFLIGMGAAERMSSAEADDRLSLRHLLVAPVGEQHRAVFMHRAVAKPPRFGRERLDADPGRHELDPTSTTGC